MTMTMTVHELAAAMVSAASERYELTGPLEAPEGPCLAAALRVMIDQVLPEVPEPLDRGHDAVVRWADRQITRVQLLALCDALEEVEVRQLKSQLQLLQEQDEWEGLP